MTLPHATDERFLQLPTVLSAQACLAVTGMYPAKHSSVSSISSVSHCHTSFWLCKTSFQMCKTGDVSEVGEGSIAGCHFSAPAGEERDRFNSSEWTACPLFPLRRESEKLFPSAPVLTPTICSPPQTRSFIHSSKAKASQLTTRHMCACIFTVKI